MNENLQTEKIWLSPPHLGNDELNHVKEAFESNWIAPAGPHIDKFEQKLCELTGARYAAAVNSGTAAIHLALIILGVSRGDEVLASTLTFAASINPIVYQGATPILIDSESQTANMCPEQLELAIKHRLAKGKKPKAIVLVHLYGMPAKIVEIQAIAKRYEIPIIEDAAEALGSTYDNKALGTSGMAGVYSFNGNKIITTSGGGALISDNKHFIDLAKKLASQARDPVLHYEHSAIGYNYRMSNISAAIGVGQLGVLSQRVEKRRGNYNYYKHNLQQMDCIRFLDEPDQRYFSNRWLTWLILDPKKSIKATPSRIISSLTKANIEARPLWKPMHRQPIFLDCPNFINGNSDYFFENSLCLPSGSNLTTKQLDLIISIVCANLV